MKVKIAMAPLALLMVTGTAELTTAHGAKKTTHRKVRTLTGYLREAEDANQYNLTTKNGGTREVKSGSVKRAPHVGHTMTITGVASNATLHAVKEGVKAEAKEHGHMTVTNAKMVSDSCQN